MSKKKASKANRPKPQYSRYNFALAKDEAEEFDRLKAGRGLTEFIRVLVMVYKLRREKRNGP